MDPNDPGVLSCFSDSGVIEFHVRETQRTSLFFHPHGLAVHRFQPELVYAASFIFSGSMEFMRRGVVLPIDSDHAVYSYWMVRHHPEKDGVFHCNSCYFRCDHIPLLKVPALPRSEEPTS